MNEVLEYFEAFAGCGGGHLAFERSELKGNAVGRSEICKDANRVYDEHYPGVENFGSIEDIFPSSLPNLNFIIGGSPCTQLTKLSLAGKTGDVRANLQGKDSRLFWNFVDIVKVKKPKYFLLENVANMPNDVRDQISEVLGVQPIRINSSLVSAQNRDRYYWCNWNTWQPKERGIKFQDIKIRDQYKYAYAWSKSTRNIKGVRSFDERFRTDGKAHAVTSRIHSYESVNLFSKKKIDFKPRKVFERNDLLLKQLKRDVDFRLCVPTELERLQTFDDGWTSSVSNAAGVRLMGKAFNVETMVHLLNCLATQIGE